MNHQKLDCYNVLLEVAKMLPAITKAFPRGSYFLEDQLKRALASAILNLSEGNGRSSMKERCRFFDISLGSIAETSSAIDIMTAYGYISSNLESRLKVLLTRSYQMIIKLKKS